MERRKIYTLTIVILIIAFLSVIINSPNLQNDLDNLTAIIRSNIMGIERVDDRTTGLKTIETDYDSDTTYCYDIITEVVYMKQSSGNIFSSVTTLTPMLNPETGLPLTYHEYVERAEGKSEMRNEL